MDNESKLKKHMIIVIACIFSALALLALTAGLLTRCADGFSDITKENTYEIEIKFSEEYITSVVELLKDEVYASYDQTIAYCDSMTGITVGGIERSEFANYGKCVELLCNWIESIKAGDADAYNSFFSEKYFSSNTRQDEFSMQKLYGIVITTYSEEIIDENGESYTEYIYMVDYKIRNNNGSLRSDMGSNGTRTQYILITDREGTLLIDAIYTPQ